MGKYFGLESFFFFSGPGPNMKNYPDFPNLVILSKQKCGYRESHIKSRSPFLFQIIGNPTSFYKQPLHLNM